MNARILLALVVVLATVPGGVAAQDDGFLSGFGDDEDDGGVLDTALAAASGLADRARMAVANVGAEETTAGDDAQAAQEAFNDRSGEFLDYANERTTASTEWDVIAVTFEREDSDSATVYLVATVNDSTDNYTSAEVVDDTNRTVDKELTLRDYASKHAADEVDRFHEQFVDPNESVTRAYLSRMASKYAGDDVEAPFLSTVGGA